MEITDKTATIASRIKLRTVIYDLVALAYGIVRAIPIARSQAQMPPMRILSTVLAPIPDGILLPLTKNQVINSRSRLTATSIRMMVP